MAGCSTGFVSLKEDEVIAHILMQCVEMTTLNHTARSYIRFGPLLLLESDYIESGLTLDDPCDQRPLRELSQRLAQSKSGLLDVTTDVPLLGCHGSLCGH